MKSLKTILARPAFYRRFFMIVVIILVLVRPRISSENAERELSNLNIWFVADATGSMIAKDVDNGSVRRYEKAQSDMAEIIAKLPGARYGIIAQDYSSYVAAPISTNADAAISAGAYLKPKSSVYARPTNLSDLLALASKTISSYKERYPERSNVMVFMSDGEDVSGEDLVIPNKLADSLEGAFVLGYGSKSGSTIEYINYDGSFRTAFPYVTYYQKDRDIEVDSDYNVISKIDETTLRKIANEIRGDYLHRENGSVPTTVINIFTRIAMSKPTEATNETTRTSGETYWVFAIIALFLLLWECEDTMLKLLAEREIKHA